jgi:hypothetical protein
MMTESTLLVLADWRLVCNIAKPIFVSWNPSPYIAPQVAGGQAALEQEGKEARLHQTQSGQC